MREFQQTEIARMLEQGFIEPATAEKAALFVFAPKMMVSFVSALTTEDGTHYPRENRMSYCEWISVSTPWAIQFLL